MVVIKWSNTAKYDLQQIFEYVSKDSEYYAKQVIREIIEKSESLRDFPQMGRTVPEINNIYVRELIIYSYRLVYQISSKDEIQVLALIHAKRLFPVANNDHNTSESI